MKRESLILLLLFLCATGLAAVMWWNGQASWLDAVGFVTGALCVWLVVRENVWNFPLGLVNVTAYSIVYWEQQLFADAGLQVVYFVLNLLGWYWWLYGGEQATALKVRRVSLIELLIVTAGGIGCTLLLWQILAPYSGSASFWDALTASFSLSAQWLLNRKFLESWWFWIVVDIIYVPLYLSKNLYLSAILYAVFLVMATLGLLHWRRVMLGANAELQFNPEPRGIA
jgi:nicotinamide mononucleotide transporter